MDKHSIETFRIFYNEYIDAIYNYVYYRVGRHRAQAEDVTSDIFLRAASKFDMFDEKRGTFKSWIYRIAHNELVNHYRSYRETVTLNEALELRDDTQSVLDSLEADDTKKEILSAMEKLTDEERTILHLRYFEDFSYDEIAEVIGKTSGALRVQTHRLLEYMNNELVNKIL